MARILEPAKGVMDWNAVMMVKRNKKRQKAELERKQQNMRDDPYNLDKNYNCVKHIQN